MGMGIRVWRRKNKRKKENETYGPYGCMERKEKE